MLKTKAPVISDPDVLVAPAQLEVITADGDLVVGDIGQFPNIETAMKFIKDAVREGEGAKLRVAKAVRSIRQGEQYRELGYSTFPEFLGGILPLLEGVGLGAKRTVQQYLAMLDVFVTGCQLDERALLAAPSHFAEALKLAHRDKETGELTDTDKEGKLQPGAVEALSQFLWFAVSTKKDAISGEEVGAALIEAGQEHTASVVAGLLGGTLPAIPAGGWAVEDTKELVKAIRGEEVTKKARMLFVTDEDKSGDDAVWLTRIVFQVADEDGDFQEVNVTEVGAMFMSDDFAALSKKGKVVKE